MKLALYSHKFKNPLKILKELSSVDIALWQAYDNLYPFGQFHTDYLIAQLSAIMFNMWKAKEVEPLTVEDILGISQPLTEEYVRATIKSFKGN